MWCAFPFSVGTSGGYQLDATQSTGLLSPVQGVDLPCSSPCTLFSMLYHQHIVRFPAPVPHIFQPLQLIKAEKHSKMLLGVCVCVSQHEIASFWRCTLSSITFSHAKGTAYASTSWEPHSLILSCPDNHKSSGSKMGTAAFYGCHKRQLGRRGTSIPYAQGKGTGPPIGHLKFVPVILLVQTWGSPRLHVAWPNLAVEATTSPIPTLPSPHPKRAHH